LIAFVDDSTKTSFRVRPSLSENAPACLPFLNPWPLGLPHFSSPGLFSLSLSFSLSKEERKEKEKAPELPGLVRNSNV
jgi:hypothetical protein